MTKFEIACHALLARLEFAIYSVDAYLAGHRGDTDEMIRCQAAAQEAQGRLDRLAINWRMG